MRVEDVYVQQRRPRGRLREMPGHHTLEAYLHDYLEQIGLCDEPKGRCPHDRARHRAAEHDAAARRRTMRDGEAPGACRLKRTKIGNRTFGGTGITADLKNGGTLENKSLLASLCGADH
ncbi:hypothetical protein [Paraburkholderia humisilvae]